ncbi:stomatin-like protein mitochondrial isoform x2 [Limosa lapponica baueri]|uniref:Stomatin-like protein mitochondrial isoform x2 n=1 Tax=Limosa lapponica baueri TaxID=1758121 RepID=A0A2I0TVF9_LIMLA|nr:stomatin-like protein mitochondrial isoform x2 [Limosa lapponica baueri]
MSKGPASKHRLEASYGVEDPEYAVTQLAQTTMRSELGKLSLDRVFRERESLNANIVDAINQASDYWGIRCLRYEIKDIHVPPRVKESMQMQVWFSGRAVWNKREVSPSMRNGCSPSRAGSAGPSCGEGNLLALWLPTYSS